MSIEHLGGDYFLYKGHILKAGQGEWGIVDAIRAFDRQHQSSCNVVSTSYSTPMSREEANRAEQIEKERWQQIRKDIGVE